MHKYSDKIYIDGNVDSHTFGSCLAGIPERIEAKIENEKDIPVWSTLSIKCSFDDQRNLIVADYEMYGCLDADRIQETILEVESLLDGVGNGQRTYRTKTE